MTTATTQIDVPTQNDTWYRFNQRCGREPHSIPMAAPPESSSSAVQSALTHRAAPARHDETEFTLPGPREPLPDASTDKWPPRDSNPHGP